MKSLLVASLLLLAACDGRPLTADAPDLTPACGALGEPCCADAAARCAAGLICLGVPDDPDGGVSCYQPVPR